MHLLRFEGRLKLAPCQNLLRMIEDSEATNAIVAHRLTYEKASQEDKMRWA